jgi:hypothetical protein
MRDYWLEPGTSKTYRAMEDVGWKPNPEREEAIDEVLERIIYRIDAIEKKLDKYLI